MCMLNKKRVLSQTSNILISVHAASFFLAAVIGSFLLRVPIGSLLLLIDQSNIGISLLFSVNVME